jgi:hypothetical protein
MWRFLGRFYFLLVAIFLGAIIVLQENSCFINSVEAVEYGLAAEYPEDYNIKNHPSVIFASGFESSDWATVDFGHTGVAWNVSQVTNPNLAFSNNGVLQYQNIAGTHSPGIYKIHTFETDNTIFLRWYRKYESGYDFSCQSKMNGVYALADGVDSSTSAGIRPNGYDKYSSKIQAFGEDLNGNSYDGGFEPRLYTYHPEQTNEWQGYSYGDSLQQNIGDILILEVNRWYCFEIMLKPNVVGQHNGELKMWIDGELKTHYYSMRFRDTDDLKINELEINAYMGGQCTASKDQNLWDDNLVLATEYIGPMVEGGQITGTIIDNLDTDNTTNKWFTTEVGQDSTDTWETYTSTTGEHYDEHYDGSHMFNNNLGDGDKATWHFIPEKSGMYKVYGWWWGLTYRPVDVPYTINNANGSEVVEVNQQENGGRWNLLGKYQFKGGEEYTVEVSDNATQNSDETLKDVVADAIRLVYYVQCYGVDNMINSNDGEIWASIYGAGDTSKDINSDEVINTFEYAYLVTELGEECEN